MKTLFLSIIIISTLILFINKINCQVNNIEPRIYPTCTLIQSTIYCLGGFTQFNSDHSKNVYNTTYLSEIYTHPVNDHIALDLSPLNNRDDIDITILKWEKKSSLLNNTPLDSIGFATSTSIHHDDSYLVYGGQVNNALHPLSHPLLNYNPQTDHWKSLPLPNGHNYTTGGTIVNIGDDNIWIWGGTINNTQTNVSDIVYIYDYKKNLLMNRLVGDGNVRVGHSTILISNGIILIMGGIYKMSNLTYFDSAGFNSMRKFDTKNMQWLYLTAVGDHPSGRIGHTATQSPDSNLVLIYGGIGISASGFRDIPDTYYIYNIVSNTLQYVYITPPSSSPTITRFGHYATCYSTKYLFLLFGYVDEKTPATSLSVLDITDPYHAAFLTDPASSSSDSTPLPNSGLPSEKVIPIAVCVCVAVVVTIFAIFFYIRRKRKQKKAFILDQQDPRKQNALDRTNPFHTTTKPHEAKLESITLAEDNNTSISLKRMDDQGPLFQHTNKHGFAKLFEDNTLYSKPDGKP
ncbi:unnamed protein product [Cunninghamella blakesleeana]